MSIFRPSLRTATPDGREWEIYAYRLRFRKRGATFDPGLADDDPVAPHLLPFEAERDLLDALLWLLGLIARLFVRLVWDLPRAGLDALGSDRWTVEAVTWYPQRTSHTWITERAHRQQVVADVGRGLADGELPPHPANATYAGEERG